MCAHHVRAETRFRVRVNTFYN